MVGHRSVSQFTSYAQCSERYRLERLDNVPQRPAGWTLQGLAVHEAVETWEKGLRQDPQSVIIETYETAWHSHLDRLLKDEPNTDRWLTGNVRVKGQTDIDRRYERGKKQLADYIADAESSEWEIWETPDFDLAIELPFRLDLNGVEVVGYIDQIREYPDGSLELVDLKTGTKIPEWDFQLGVYRLAVLESYGVRADSGSFYMLKDNRYTPRTDLTRYTRDRLSVWFDSLNRGVEGAVFMPNVGDHCRMCGVWDYCSAKGYKEVHV
ncbi:RecB family exonuclease [Streptomyces smyrnaeus]|uniref:RecB family exonuclease n=1 Tax=Streptomyces smyrnaeus TaxID=1387713 RepID=UPI0036A92F23